MKRCIFIGCVENIISKNLNIGHSSIREDLRVDNMINYSFLIFHHFNHYIKDLVPLSSDCLFSLNSIHVLNTKLTILSIERNIGVIFFKPVYIIGWWNEVDSSMNGKFFILECISDIQNSVSESMYIRNRNVDSGLVSMCHWTFRVIKINILNLRSPICTVACNKFPCIRTVAFVYSFINE